MVRFGAAGARKFPAANAEPSTAHIINFPKTVTQMRIVLADRRASHTMVIPHASLNPPMSRPIESHTNSTMTT